jgi:hypothetical protein
MLGLDDDYRGALEQAYHAYCEAADALRAARCAWWIGHNLLFLGQSAPAEGWIARGQRLLEREDRDSVERGYLLIPTLIELSAVVAGIVYCNTIAFCRDVYELRRAREWTEALTPWCEQQPDMVAHKGFCLVHRAEIMTLGGAWPEALQEARRVAEQFTQGC